MTRRYEIRTAAIMYAVSLVAGILLAAAALTGSNGQEAQELTLNVGQPTVVAFTPAPITARPAPPPAPATPSASTRPASTPTGYPPVIVPAGGKECGRFGEGPLSAVGTENASTSCPFALNVRDAYVQSGLNGATGTVTAYSPVTKLTYKMSCNGSQPALCTGGKAARVIVYGGTLVTR